MTNFPFQIHSSALQQMGPFSVSFSLGSHILIRNFPSAEWLLQIGQFLPSHFSLSLAETDIVERELGTVNETGSYLQQLQKELSQNLTKLRSEINKTLDECGTSCQHVSVNNLVLASNFNEVKRDWEGKGIFGWDWQNIEEHGNKGHSQGKQSQAAILYMLIWD